MSPRLVVALLALCTVTAGCRGSTEPATALEVTALASRSQAPIGETIRIEVTATNTSMARVTVAGFPSAFVEVRNEAGEVVAFGRYEIIAAIPSTPVVLAPGEALHDSAPWAGEVSHDSGWAVAGTYRVRAAVLVLDGGGAYAYSDPVDVVLTEP